MNKLNYSIVIGAPKEKVWDVMLGDVTYREWTSAFSPGSYYEGSWEKGSKIRFIGPDPEGKTAPGGLFAEIADNRPYEFISIKQLGEIQDGIEAPWAADKVIYENYTFLDKSGGTEVLVEMTGLPDEYMKMFDDSWPRALEKLKEIAER